MPTNHNSPWAGEPNQGYTLPLTSLGVSQLSSGISTSPGSQLSFDASPSDVSHQPRQIFARPRCSHPRKECDRIPRPPNAFLIYRSDYCAAHPLAKNQSEISKIAGNEWKMLTDAEKALYEERAALAEAEHALMYPGYRYQPRRKASTVKKAADLVCYQEEMAGTSGTSTMERAEESSIGRVVDQTMHDRSFDDSSIGNATPGVSGPVSDCRLPASSTPMFRVKKMIMRGIPTRPKTSQCETQQIEKYHTTQREPSLEVADHFVICQNRGTNMSDRTPSSSQTVPRIFHALQHIIPAHDEQHFRNPVPSSLLFSESCHSVGTLYRARVRRGDVGELVELHKHGLKYHTPFPIMPTPCSPHNPSITNNYV